MRGTKWTEEELEYLEESWGKMTTQGIASNLDRTYSANRKQGPTIESRRSADSHGRHHNQPAIEGARDALPTHYELD